MSHNEQQFSDFQASSCAATASVQRRKAPSEKDQEFLELDKIGEGGHFVKTQNFAMRSVEGGMHADGKGNTTYGPTDTMNNQCKC
ncbi:hypothetical protein ANO14919_068520 [Xylariales sp. No.14919]|nr:hypothetical protein ANO14919_068520 [Xylariales sp. No.14919]